MRKTGSEGHGRRIRRTLALAGVLLVTACAPGAEEAPDATTAVAYEGARLIVGDGSGPIEDSVFVVDNGVFMAVGARADVDVPEGAARVDLTGQTVMPAIIDAHKHVAQEREALVEQLEHFAYYGVGLVISLGQDTALAFEVRDERIPGAARLTTAGRGITRPEPGRSEAPYWISTEEEGREAVRELAEQQVDLVKIWVDDRNGQYEKLGPDLYGPIIEEAHAYGLRVAAHIFSLEDAKGLVAAGVDAFAHGVRDMDVDDEFIAMIQENPDLVLIPNMPDRGVAVDLGWLAGTVPADQLAEMQAGSTDRPEAQETHGIQARNLDRMNQAGTLIALGTDGGTPWAAHLEMEDMVAAGMTPSEVLVAATSNAADVLGVDDMGTVAAGMSADFIVLDANPLDVITNTRQIDAVYLRGDAVDRAALGARLSASSE